MNNVAMISIKPEYSSKILSRTKSIELRRSSLGLSKDDVLLVYESSPKQVLGLWFYIAEVETLPVDKMWVKYHAKLGINHEEYITYYNGSTEATGFHIGDIYQLETPIPLHTIKELVPDFVPPQSILWIRDDILRFQKLLSVITPKIPSEILPQTPLLKDY